MHNIATLLRRSSVLKERIYDFNLFKQEEDHSAVRFVTARKVII